MSMMDWLEGRDRERAEEVDSEPDREDAGEGSGDAGPYDDYDSYTGPTFREDDS